MEKRNKKLLEWVGVETIIAIDNGDMIWRDKDGNDWYAEYFTNSLDACFKWLVPKLYEQNYCYDLLQWNNGQHKAIINETTTGWAVTASDAVAETPALALCLAMEKLIDGDKEV